MYIVLEVQTNRDETVGTIVFTYTDANEAESKYHGILSAAAISTVPIHTAFLLRNDGYLVKSDGYTHLTEEQDGAAI